MKAICSVAVLAVMFAFGGQAQAASPNPGVHVDCVAPYTTDSYTVYFYGGETAAVAMRGYGAKVLRLEVYDMGGHLIDCSSDAHGPAIVSWVPNCSGSFVIKVVNVNCEAQVYGLARN